MVDNQRIKASCISKCYFNVVLLSILIVFCPFTDAATINVKTGGQKAALIDTPNISIGVTAKGNAGIQCANTQYLNEPGQPQIPWKVITVLLPPNADLSTVSYTVNNITYSPVEGDFDIEPSPMIGTWDEDGNPVLVMPAERTVVDGYDVDIYNTDTYWPQQDARISGKVNFVSGNWLRLRFRWCDTIR